MFVIIFLSFKTDESLTQVKNKQVCPYQNSADPILMALNDALCAGPAMLIIQLESQKYSPHSPLPHMLYLDHSIFCVWVICVNYYFKELKRQFKFPTDFKTVSWNMEHLFIWSKCSISHHMFN